MKGNEREKLCFYIEYYKIYPKPQLLLAFLAHMLNHFHYKEKKRETTIDVYD